jgi:DnaJ-class molecular chaperone
MTDYYATLGVAKTATAEEIKRAYRRLASQHHPDRGGNTEKFQQIQAAYDTLGDAAKRAAYDNPQPQFGGFGFQQGQNIHDIFSQMFGQQPRRGHIRMTIGVDLVDVINGSTRTVQLGTTQGSNTVEIAIPRGIDNGDTVQYGGIGPGGSDLMVQFRVNPVPNWRREGINLHTEVQVSIWQLILGSEITMTALTGNELTITVPPMTQPNTVMRLRAHGVHHRSGQQGDIMVRIVAQIPQNIPAEVMAAIQQHCP